MHHIHWHLYFCFLYGCPAFDCSRYTCHFCISTFLHHSYGLYTVERTVFLLPGIHIWFSFDYKCIQILPSNTFSSFLNAPVHTRLSTRWIFPQIPGWRGKINTLHWVCLCNYLIEFYFKQERKKDGERGIYRLYRCLFCSVLCWIFP